MFKSIVLTSALEQFDVIQLVESSTWTFLYSVNNVCIFAALTVAISVLFFPEMGSLKMFHTLSTPMIFFKKLTFMSKKLFGENLTVCGGVFFVFFI